MRAGGKAALLGEPVMALCAVQAGAGSIALRRALSDSIRALAEQVAPGCQGVCKQRGQRGFRMSLTQ